MSNRIGKFCVDERMIRLHWEVIAPLMANFVVVQVQNRFDIMAMEYTALSPLFAEVEEFSYAPQYEVNFIVKPGMAASVEVKPLHRGDHKPAKVTRKLVI